MINVEIITPVGIQICQLDNGLLINTSVPASVARQIEEAVCFERQRKGIAIYEGEDHYSTYKYEFLWELKLGGKNG
jgi:hypothetical protein